MSAPSTSAVEDMVMQYLFERGLHGTLLELEREVGREYAPSGEPQMLIRSLARLAALLDVVEPTLAADPDSDDAVLMAGLPAGDIAFVDAPAAHQLAPLPHPANVTSLAYLGPGRLLSGCVDSTLRLWAPNESRDEPVATLASVLAGPVVAMDAACEATSGPSVIVSDMAGGVALVAETDDGGLVVASKIAAHSGPVCTVAMARDGSVAASASYDHTVALLRDGAVVHRASFDANIEGVVFLPTTSGAPETLVAAPRESPALSLIDVASGTVTSYNMNPLGDAWADYSVLDLAVPCHDESFLVMATTDKSKSLLFDVRTPGGPVRHMRGPANNGYALPAHFTGPLHLRL
ncbi:uncharacterized protein AMSG_10886 [Thecamonas trahens ATCC 50062]|uniref:Uncharacterized protein n=1 Tax=Thecamonas trahens ATCC 50062 TaxID=461836 RepID=A0A0L0DSR3_THETB|nr:hypothetical protein AMSG_10886 [Thecamonas trahens ATCC 50062]KNC55252.1 hypothetical protein AMSG_10886 [Thecamonas trahens ATCC 50062]|eukprot:XP_013753181.1 hypothetical protein AMSG_10886 [Thecamonas trahens ATCC 50062]